MSNYVKAFQEPAPQARRDIQFLSTLKYRDFARNLWEYTEAFRFRYKGVTHVIPNHFITDFYSIPRWLRWVWPNNQGVYNESSGIHDWAVRNRKLLGFSLTDCHTLFSAAMEYQGMSNFRRRVKFAAVYMFNWSCAGEGDGTLPEYMRKEVERIAADTGVKYSLMRS